MSDGDVGFARGDLPGVLDGEAGAVERDRAGAGGAAERAGMHPNTLRGRLETVSYTHLDVYKRQA